MQAFRLSTCLYGGTEFYFSLLRAFRTETVRKLRARVIPDVLLDLDPPLRLALDPLALRADAKQAAQEVDLFDCRLQFLVSRLKARIVSAQLLG